MSIQALMRWNGQNPRQTRRRRAGVNSIDTDGVKQGFDIPMLLEIAKRVDVPIIASGGAGKKEDFLRPFSVSADRRGTGSEYFPPEGSKY